MPAIPDKCRLFHVPYRPARLQVGNRAFCPLRGTVVITSWTDARVSWPRCIAVGVKGGVGVLLDDELARAVRTEAAAVCHWWGVSHGVVVRWRKALGVNRVNNPRTHQLVKASAQAGADAAKGREGPEEERQAQRGQARRPNMGGARLPGYPGPPVPWRECKPPGKH